MDFPHYRFIGIFPIATTLRTPTSISLLLCSHLVIIGRVVFNGSREAKGATAPLSFSYFKNGVNILLIPILFIINYYIILGRFWWKRVCQFKKKVNIILSYWRLKVIRRNGDAVYHLYVILHVPRYRTTTRRIDKLSIGNSRYSTIGTDI